MPLHVGIGPLALTAVSSIRVAYGTNEPQLQARINAEIAFLAPVANMFIYDVQLGGAGDGQAWEAVICGVVDAAPPIADLVEIDPNFAIIRAIIAASETALRNAINLFLLSLAATDAVHKILIAGGGAGAQWCALVVVDSTPPPPP